MQYRTKFIVTLRFLHNGVWKFVKYTETFDELRIKYA